MQRDYRYAWFATTLLLAVGSRSHAEDAPQRSLEIYGSAQADAIYDFQRVDPDWEDALRPSKISAHGQFGTDGQTTLSVKQSRFGVKGSMPTGTLTQPLKFKFEFDLFGTGSDAGRTAFHLQHAYGEWGPVLAGQTDSLFMDGDVFPNTIDYWGPTGMVFFRNVQIRWTPFRSDAGHFALAIERPGNDIDPGNLRLVGAFSSAELQNNEEAPDLTVQWRADGSWGHFQAAGILRRVGFEYRANPNSEFKSGSQTGWGINLGSALKTFGEDKLLLQVVYGEGIASYMNDGGMDLAPQVSSPLPNPVITAEAVPLTGIVAYYDHYWSPTWSSSIGYSLTEVSNTNFQEPTAYHKGQYASVNLLKYPVENLMIGSELLWGLRTDNDGTRSDDMRVQFSVKYSFGGKF